jgi:hypothetical protein
LCFFSIFSYFLSTNLLFTLELQTAMTTNGHATTSTHQNGASSNSNNGSSNGSSNGSAVGARDTSASRAPGKLFFFFARLTFLFFYYN